MAKSITFVATIAPLQSAFTVASDGGVLVKIDIPESDMDAAKRLMDLRGKVLRVTIAAGGTRRATQDREWGDDGEDADLG